jgi:transcriptional regulator with XRE-family HTH domain
MKEFAVTVKMQNNLLLERREKTGLSAEKMAEAIGISYHIYLKYEGMYTGPIGKNGWKRTALKILDYWKTTPDQLWPESVLNVEKNVVKKKFDASDMGLFLGESTMDRMLPLSEHIERKHLAESLDRFMDERFKNSGSKHDEIKIVKMRLGIGCDPMPFREIGKNIGVCGARAKQIYDKAIRKMRWGGTTEELEEFAEGFGAVKERIRAREANERRRAINEERKAAELNKLLHETAVVNPRILRFSLPVGN